MLLVPSTPTSVTSIKSEPSVAPVHHFCTPTPTTQIFRASNTLSPQTSPQPRRHGKITCGHATDSPRKPIRIQDVIWLRKPWARATESSWSIKGLNGTTSYQGGSGTKASAYALRSRSQQTSRRRSRRHTMNTRANIEMPPRPTSRTTLRPCSPDCTEPGGYKSPRPPDLSPFAILSLAGVVCNRRRLTTMSSPNT